MDKLLLITVLLPALTALAISGNKAVARTAALVVSLIVFAASVVLIAAFPGGKEAFAKFDYAWLSGVGAPFDVRFSLALDGLSVWLFGLTSLLAVTSILVSWEAIADRPALFYQLLLTLETGMLGVFTAQDVILFYVFFEFTLIPLFFMIGIWGSELRRYAAVKFFLFTLAGSLLTFLGLLTVALWDYYHPIGDASAWRLTFSIPDLIAHYAARPMDPTVQLWIFIALFAGFAVKVPLFPLHTWLPLAHVQAPAAGSILLAGVLLKIGTYGFLRFSLPMLPQASVVCMPWVMLLAAAGIIYGALVALAQQDVKRLIAYSSVSHLGFCMLGIFSGAWAGIEGGALQMINHGLSTGGLFAVVGMIYERFHTREIANFGGLARKLPVLSFFMLALTLSSIGLPGLNGFVGEFLILLGAFQRGWSFIAPVPGELLRAVAVASVFGVLLGAWYMLWLYQRVFFGPARESSKDKKHHHDVRDMNVREVCALAPLIVLIVWIGVQPNFFLKRMSPTLRDLSRNYVTALDDAARAPGPEYAGTVERGEPQEE